MTRNQFAMAVNADEKWIENTAYLLGLSLKFTPSDVTWMGLVRIFNHGLGLTLARSSELASESLRYEPATREVLLGKSPVREGALVLDIARFYSGRNAALSAGLNLGGPRRRGRRSSRIGRDSLSRARKYGIDIDALRIGLNDSPATRLERLELNAHFLDAMRQTNPSMTRLRKNTKRKLDR